MNAFTKDEGRKIAEEFSRYSGMDVSFVSLDGENCEYITLQRRQFVTYEVHELDGTITPSVVLNKRNGRSGRYGYTAIKLSREDVSSMKNISRMFILGISR